MVKKEVIWREILFQKRQNNIIQFTQKELSKKFGFSISTVFNALKPLRQANIVRVTGRFFVLEDYKKLLYLWASLRNTKKVIYHQLFIGGETAKTESIMPPEAVFGLYGGFKVLYNFIPAEYDHIYIYLKKADLSKLTERVSGLVEDGSRTRPRGPAARSRLVRDGRGRNHNLYVLEPDPWFEKYPQPLFEQLFVDIWNAPEWYAKDFLKTLEDKIAL